MAVAETTFWGRDFMWPDEGSPDNGTEGWLSRITFPEPDVAISAALTELRDWNHPKLTQDQIRLVPVLMREQSEVEAKIAGAECPMWVECTTRARHCEPFWRVEIVEAQSDGKDTE